MTEQDLTPAESILLDAGDIIRARLKEHGHTERSFTLAAELWTSYIKHAFLVRGKTELYAHDVAQLLSLLKNTRSVYGESGDNYKDSVGYMALAGMLHKETTNGK